MLAPEDPAPGPLVFCPFPPRIAPGVDEVHRDALHWATRHGLLDRPGARSRFARAKFANLMARAHPDAGLADLKLVTAWLIAIFVLDDLLERALVRDPGPTGAAVGELDRWLRGADGGTPGPLMRSVLGRPLTNALDDVWRRTEPRVSPAWRERFQSHVADYLAGTVWEAGNRTHGRPPSLDEYRANRFHSAATEMFFDLIEPMHGIELPAELFADPDFRLMRRSAGMIIGIFNDLVSWPKEAAIGDHHNIVFALQREGGLTLADAVGAAVAEHDLHVVHFIDARDRLTAGPWGRDAAVATAVGDLVHWIRGNLDWSLESGRYAPSEAASIPQPRRPSV